MNALDAHYSALWVAYERSAAESKPKAKYTIHVAVEGYTEVEIEASSRAEAIASAMDRVEIQGMTVTDLSIEDVEEWK